METKHVQLTIAGFEICPIPTGQFALDGGAMFGTVPKVLWEKSNPPDSKNRIAMEARGLLLKSKNKNILIDSGNGGDFIAKYGEKLGTKFAEMYGVDGKDVSLLSSLEKFDTKPEQITDVILTHLHFDHAGGATTEKNQDLVPTFPKAQYWLQEENLKTASQPNLREKASYFPAAYQPLQKAKVLNLIKGDKENLFPGISVFVSNGHTRGQQLVKISDEKNTLVYCGDVVPTSSHVRIPWIMGYDLHPLLLMEEKEKLLTQAADKGWYLYFEHDPYCDMAQIERNGADFKVRERFWGT
jgi:glyoxylase-like metal-dependent hydrolase (beta-lactamase superfamily II)